MEKNYRLSNHIFFKSSFFLFLFINTQSFGQEIIKGKITSEIDNYEEILIINSTRNTFSKIDTEGEFEITAFLNDTIKINSHSYKESHFIVTKKHFENSIEISLKDNIEDLKEIIIDSNFINDEELAEINQQLQSQIKNDIKNNPYQYTKPNSGGNLFGIVLLAIDLFRKKEPETVESPVVLIKHQDLSVYFEKDDRFLVEELNIPKDQISYFFLFIEDQKIPAKLLTDSNRFFFLEELTVLRDEFFKN